MPRPLAGRGWLPRGRGTAALTGTESRRIWASMGQQQRPQHPARSPPSTAQKPAAPGTNSSPPESIARRPPGLAVSTRRPPQSPLPPAESLPAAGHTAPRSPPERRGLVPRRSYPNNPADEQGPSTPKPQSSRPKLRTASLRPFFTPHLPPRPSPAAPFVAPDSRHSFKKVSPPASAASTAPHALALALALLASSRAWPA